MDVCAGFFCDIHQAVPFGSRRQTDTFDFGCEHTNALRIIPGNLVEHNPVRDVHFAYLDGPQLIVGVVQSFPELHACAGDIGANILFGSGNLDGASVHI